MKEYIVTFTTVVKISPDDWATQNPTMKVTEYTTVKEIEAFFRKYAGGVMMQVKLIELEPIPNK